MLSGVKHPRISLKANAEIFVVAATAQNEWGRTLLSATWLISPLFIHNMQQWEAMDVPSDVLAEKVQRPLDGWVRMA